jgi:cystathionine beta-lyase/cystathionine gamma-synthase
MLSRAKQSSNANARIQAASWGVEADLVRFSVGLEDTSKLVGTFQRALEAIADTDTAA